MTETPDWDAVRRRARARAVRMGHTKPETEAAPETAAPLLPKKLTDHPGALRGMLATGRLTREQADAARAFLANLTAPSPEFPEDAA